MSLDDELAARARAEAVRDEHDVPAPAALARLERRIIELARDGDEAASPVRDCVAWVARFEDAASGSWVELALEQASGAVVRVLRSR